MTCLCVCAEGEKLTSGELEEFIRQVISSGTLQEVGAEVSSQQPKEMLRAAMSLSATTIDKFLQELSEGRYDSPHPKTKVGRKGSRDGIQGLLLIRLPLKTSSSVLITQIP